MKASQYAKIAEHPLRQVFRNLVTDARDLPTRSQLRASIEAAVPEADAKVKEALFTRAVELAQKAQAEGRESWFDLRGSADRLVLHTLEGFEAADRLLPSEDTEPVDVSGVLDAMDNYNPGEKAMRERFNSPAARAQEIETARKLAGS